MRFYPEFNLGPLFLLNDLATEIYEMKKREFVYKVKPSGQLATYFTKLKNHEEGAAVDSGHPQDDRGGEGPPAH